MKRTTAKRAAVFRWAYSDDSDSVLVLGSNEKGEFVVAQCEMPADQSEREGLEPQVLQAEKLILDLNSGRQKPNWEFESKAG